MIEPKHPKLSIVKQCDLVRISRSSFYYEGKGETPYYGSRQMARHLRRQGYNVGRKRIRRLMRQMGLQAVFQRPRTSIPHPEHRVYPYLLRGLQIDKPNQVWCADITYIPLQRGYLYLVAIMDWYSRKVLSWRLSNTLEADFCVDALEQALNEYGPPEIMNTDQGSQFTSLEFTQTLKDAGVRISMDGKGRWMDNIFIERLWRSLKYESVYLYELVTGSQARKVIGTWIRRYSDERPHLSIGDRTPTEAYFELELGSSLGSCPGMSRQDRAA